MNGVSEVYIYCGSHTDTVEEYVSRSHWATTSRSSPFSVVHFIRVAGARSVGDVLRDMDKRSLVDGDFLIVHGDLVSNLKLDKAIAAHRKRREESAANIMTMVLRTADGPDHRAQSKGITPLFVVDNKTQRCLHYDEMHPLQSDHYLSLDPTIPDELSADFELRADLIDPQVDICTAGVLALWTEGFDYELPRRNFLHGVLKDWELNGNMIYTEILEDGYCARANNLQQYDAVCKDMIDGLCFPIVPFTNTTPSETYACHGGMSAVANGASCAVDAVILRSFIAKGTSVGAGSKVTNAIIGKGCQIGSNVTLNDCFIWDNVTIEDGTRISQSIIADDAIVGKNCEITSGVLVSFNVYISDNIKLSNGALISTVSSSGKPLTKDTTLLGDSTNAATFVDEDEDGEDDEDPSRLQKSLIYNLENVNISTSSISTLSSDIDSDDDEDEGFITADTARSRLSSFASDDSSGRAGFHSDAVHGLLDALRAESGDFDSAKLEFMGLRLANDASDQMMRKAVATAFARRAAELLTPEHGSHEPTKAAEKVLTASQGAAKFVAEVGVAGEESEQVEFILYLQKALQHVKGVEMNRAGVLLAALLQQLYALDILEEEGITEWWEDERAAEGEGMTTLREKCRVLVEWLENADEEDSDEDSDDE